MEREAGAENTIELDITRQRRRSSRDRFEKAAKNSPLGCMVFLMLHLVIIGACSN